jgi:DNA helicase HerA-like ATPase
LLLGITTGGEQREPVTLKEGLRPTHLAIVGLSGVGKSYLIENLIRQDIQQGTGFVLFDVHGDLADSVVAYIANRVSKHRELADNIVLIEPFDPVASIGFNPLEQASGSSAHAQAQELASVLRVHCF